MNDFLYSRAVCEVLDLKKENIRLNLLIKSCNLSTDLIKEVLTLDEQIQALAQELYQQKSLLVMGRGFQFATCLEGALVIIIIKNKYICTTVQGSH